MSKSHKKNFRFSNETARILDAVCAFTGENESRVTELALSLYALTIGAEITRANEFLYNNLLSRAAKQSLHQPGNAREKLAAVVAAQVAAHKLHRPNEPLRQRAKK
jgi:uncharacterized protein involved in response to NO